MATIANLAVIISANTSRFASGMSKASRVVESFSRKVEVVTRKAVKFGSALVAAAVSALALVVRQASKTIDSLGKTADKLGIATESLAGFQLAADKAGVSSQTLGKSMERMVRRVQDAADGTGEAVKALEELGLTADRLASLSVEKQLFTIADSLGEIESQATRAQLAYRIFGRDGIALTNLLRDGSGALRENIEQAQEFGTALNRIDVRKVEMFNDSMRDLKELIRGAALEITVNLAPFLNAIVERITEMGLEARQSGFTAVTAMEMVATGMAKVIDWIAYIRVGFKLLQLGAQTTALAISEFFAETFSSIVDSIDGMIAALQAMAKVAAKVTGGKVGAVAESAADAAAGVLGAVSKAVGEVGVQFARDTRTITKTMKKLQESIQEDLDKGLPSQRVLEFFDDIRRKADEAARRSLEGRTFGGFGDLEDVAGGAAKSADFQQVIRRFAALDVSPAMAVRKEKPVRAEQVEDTNAILRTIERKLPGTARVA